MWMGLYMWGLHVFAMLALGSLMVLQLPFTVQTHTRVRLKENSYLALDGNMSMKGCLSLALWFTGDLSEVYPAFFAVTEIDSSPLPTLNWISRQKKKKTMDGHISYFWVNKHTNNFKLSSFMCFMSFAPNCLIQWFSSCGADSTDGAQSYCRWDAIPE